MKHYMLLCAAISLLFSSCGKEKRITPDDGEKKYPVKFDVSGFTQIYEPQVGATGKVKTNDVDSLPVTDLTYVVFKDNKVLSIKTSKKGNVGFGTFTDELPAGNYQVTFGGGSPAGVGVQNTSYGLETHLLTGDGLFFKKVPISVTTNAITQNVQLKRISSQLVVNINDAIPAGVLTIGVTLKDSTGYIMIAEKYQYYGERTVSKNITTTDVGKVNYRIIVNNSNNITPFKVTIFYVENGKVITKAVPNVVCKTNMRTILSGDLFTTSNAEFQTKIDSAWNTPVYQDF